MSNPYLYFIDFNENSKVTFLLIHKEVRERQKKLLAEIICYNLL